MNLLNQLVMKIVGLNPFFTVTKQQNLINTAQNEEKKVLQKSFDVVGVASTGFGHPYGKV